MKLAAAFCTAGLLWAAPAFAGDRPDEDSMFGAPASAPQVEPAPTEPPPTVEKKQEAEPPPAAPKPERSRPEKGKSGSVKAQNAPTAEPAPAETDARDSLNLGAPDGATRFSAEVAPEDPLKIGGQWYWRLASSGRQDQAIKNWSVQAPSLLDLFLDARPNDRVRAFARGRMQYDPTRAPNGTTQSLSLASAGGASQGLDAVAQGRDTRGPFMYMDQLWLRFDVQHTAFITAGKQHVRWGTGRIWAPGDFLHLQVRNPLSPFDARTGTTMVKVHVPWEAEGWNFYAYGIPENNDKTGTISQIAGAARAEIVLGTMELGMGVMGRKDSKAKFASDVSFALGDFDFHGEFVVRNRLDADRIAYTDRPATTPTCPAIPNDWNDPSKVSAYQQALSLYFPALVSAYFPKQDAEDAWKVQALWGISRTTQYADKDTVTVGIEYFYNGLGYTSPKDYWGLLLPRADTLNNPAQFFYLGRNYLGGFVTLPAPYSWDTSTFGLSSLLNMTDWSGLTRLDYSLTLLTHIRFEAYVAVNYGQKNGEFRMGIDPTSLLQGSCLSTGGAAPTAVSPSLFSAGLGLRVAL